MSKIASVPTHISVITIKSEYISGHPPCTASTQCTLPAQWAPRAVVCRFWLSSVARCEPDGTERSVWHLPLHSSHTYRQPQDGGSWTHRKPTVHYPSLGALCIPQSQLKSGGTESPLTVHSSVSSLCLRSGRCLVKDDKIVPQGHPFPAFKSTECCSCKWDFKLPKASSDRAMFAFVLL